MDSSRRTCLLLCCTWFSTAQAGLSPENAIAFSGIDRERLTSISKAGDLDHDGCDDLLIGAIGDTTDWMDFESPDPATFNDAGGVHAVYGCGQYAPDSDIFIDVGASYLYNEIESDFIGQSMAPLGDVTGDGFPDWLMASGLAGQEDGKAVVMRGPLIGDVGPNQIPAYVFVGSMENHPTTIFRGTAGAKERFGATAASVDIDNNGFSNILIGSPHSNNNMMQLDVPTVKVPLIYDIGSLSVYHVSDFALQNYTLTIFGMIENGRFGSHVAGIPRSINSGDSTFAVTAPGERKIYVFELDESVTQAQTAIDTGKARLQIQAEAFADERTRIGGTGNFGQYKRSQIVVGTPDHQGKGSVFVLRPLPSYATSVSLSVPQICGSQSGDEFGASIAIGDFDADGIDDLAVGAPGALSDKGAAYVFYGRSMGTLSQSACASASQANVVLQGRKTGDRFGSELAADFDFNGDGREDLGIVAPGSDAGGSDSGQAYVFINSPS